MNNLERLLLEREESKKKIKELQKTHRLLNFAIANARAYMRRKEKQK